MKCMNDVKDVILSIKTFGMKVLIHNLYLSISEKEKIKGIDK